MEKQVYFNKLSKTGITKKNLHKKNIFFGYGIKELTQKFNYLH